jgi:Cu+-exporting ATPase
VFDKTGTLTAAEQITASHYGAMLTIAEQQLIASLTQPTTHALSRPVRAIMNHEQLFEVFDFQEYPGLGVSGTVNGKQVRIGTPGFMQKNTEHITQKGTILLITIDDEDKGYFVLMQGLRHGIGDLLQRLKKFLSISMLSGDLPHQARLLQEVAGPDVSLHFQQQPHDKLSYVQQLQKEGKTVGMIGDGLNDAGALKQSNVGICIAEDTNSFTPAGDAILKGTQLHMLDKLILMSKSSRLIIILCFSFSFLYNTVGLILAVQAKLSPVAAAVLMPCSTLSIILLTYIVSKICSKKLGLI